MLNEWWRWPHSHCTPKYKLRPSHKLSPHSFGHLPSASLLGWNKRGPHIIVMYKACKVTYRVVNQFKWIIRFGFFSATKLGMEENGNQLVHGKRRIGKFGFDLFVSVFNAHQSSYTSPIWLPCYLLHCQSTILTHSHVRHNLYHTSATACPTSSLAHMSTAMVTPSTRWWVDHGRSFLVSLSQS